MDDELPSYLKPTLAYRSYEKESQETLNKVRRESIQVQSGGRPSFGFPRNVKHYDAYYVLTPTERQKEELRTNGLKFGRVSPKDIFLPSGTIDGSNAVQQSPSALMMDPSSSRHDNESHGSNANSEIDILPKSAATIRPMTAPSVGSPSRSSIIIRKELFRSPTNNPTGTTTNTSTNNAQNSIGNNNLASANISSSNNRASANNNLAGRKSRASMISIVSSQTPPAAAVTEKFTTVKPSQIRANIVSTTPMTSVRPATASSIDAANNKNNSNVNSINSTNNNRSSIRQNSQTMDSLPGQPQTSTQELPVIFKATNTTNPAKETLEDEVAAENTTHNVPIAIMQEQSITDTNIAAKEESTRIIAEEVPMKVTTDDHDNKENDKDTDFDIASLDGSIHGSTHNSNDYDNDTNNSIVIEKETSKNTEMGKLVTEEVTIAEEVAQIHQLIADLNRDLVLSTSSPVFSTVAANQQHNIITNMPSLAPLSDVAKFVTILAVNDAVSHTDYLSTQSIALRNNDSNSSVHGNISNSNFNNVGKGSSDCQEVQNNAAIVQRDNCYNDEANNNITNHESSTSHSAFGTVFDEFLVHHLQSLSHGNHSSNFHGSNDNNAANLSESPTNDKNNDKNGHSRKGDIFSDDSSEEEDNHYDSDGRQHNRSCRCKTCRVLKQEKLMLKQMYLTWREVRRLHRCTHHSTNTNGSNTNIYYSGNNEENEEFEFPPEQLLGLCLSEMNKFSVESHKLIQNIQQNSKRLNK